MVSRKTPTPASPINSRIRGTGSAFPERIVGNEELCEKIAGEPGEVPEGFGPEWIVERTGVRTRHFAKPGRASETNRALAAQAARRALHMAEMEPSQIQGILYATCTPDFPMPSSACLLQAELKTRGFAMDLNAACSGFQHALTLGHSMIVSGQAETLLIIGSDVLSPVTNFRDRKSCMLFGDGAGAVVLSSEPTGSGRGLMLSKMEADGSAWDVFHVEAGGTDTPITNPAQQYEAMRMKMKGGDIFKASVRPMVALAEQAFMDAGVTASDVKWLIPHQANIRILESVAKRLGIPMNRVIVNLGERGNTSAATVPTALDQLVRSGEIKSGDLCLINVFGAGVTSGVTLLRW